MLTFLKNLGYTTENNEWEVLTNKQLALHDLLLKLNTRRGECDWDPTFGSTILDKLFRAKTETLKRDIMEEISSIFEKEPRINLIDIEAQDLDKGWTFYCEVNYLDGTPEQWILSAEEGEGVKLLSTGEYPLGA